MVDDVGCWKLISDNKVDSLPSMNVLNPGCDLIYMANTKDKMTLSLLPIDSYWNQYYAAKIKVIPYPNLW